MKYIIRVNSVVKTDVLNELKQRIMTALNNDGIVLIDGRFDIYPIPEISDVVVKEKEEKDGLTHV